MKPSSRKKKPSPENYVVVFGEALLLEAVYAAESEVLVVASVEEDAVGEDRHEEEQQHQDLPRRTASRGTTH